MGTLPRWALSLTLTSAPFIDNGFEPEDFVEGAAQAHRAINALVYAKLDEEGVSFLERTCTPSVANVLRQATIDMHGDDRALTISLASSDLRRRSLFAAAFMPCVSAREFELEHTFRGYDDVLNATEDIHARLAKFEEVCAELREIRSVVVDDDTPPVALFTELDVMFESIESMNVLPAEGQEDSEPTTVSNTQRSTWSPLARVFKHY